MIQKYIRPYGGQTYSIEEGSEIIEELDARTKSNRAGLNSVDELGAQVENLLNTGRYVGYFTTEANLNQVRPTPRTGDRALVGSEIDGLFEYNAINGIWRSNRIDISKPAEIPDWATQIEDETDF